MADLLTTQERQSLRRVIAVATGKGGVGKTSISANVAGLLAHGGADVLVVDLDSQGNLGEDLGYSTSEAADHGRGTFQSVSSGKPLVPIKSVRPHLDVVPAGEEIEDLAVFLDSVRHRRGDAAVIESLAVSLLPIAGDYDVIILDCPPKGRVIQEIALGAARWLLVPTKSDASSRKAISQIGDRFLAARNVNPTIELLGVVLFGSGTSATRLRQEILTEIAADLNSSEPLFSSVIRHAEAPAVQARNSGRLVHELEEFALGNPWWTRLRNPETAPSAPAVAQSVSGLAGDYQSLAEELVARVEHAETAEAQL